MDNDEVSIDELRKAIKHMHGCDSRWLESVQVHETHESATVWRGSVQVFELVGHSKAKRAYAWSHQTTGGTRRFLAVLEVAPVVDAVTAVRASIIAKPIR